MCVPHTFRVLKTHRRNLPSLAMVFLNDSIQAEWQIDAERAISQARSRAWRGNAVRNASRSCKLDRAWMWLIRKIEEKDQYVIKISNVIKYIIS